MRTQLIEIGDRVKTDDGAGKVVAAPPGERLSEAEGFIWIAWDGGERTATPVDVVVPWACDCMEVEGGYMAYESADDAARARAQV